MTQQFSEIEIVTVAILFVTAFLSIIASFMTLLIIYDIGKWNGYLQLISSMTVCQILYDSAFFFVVGYKQTVCVDLNLFLTSFGGLSVTVWTNIISTVVVHIVLTLKTVNISKNYWVYFLIGCVVPLIIAIVSTYVDSIGYLFADTLVYNILRCASIAYNLVAYAVLTRKLHRMKQSKENVIDPLQALSSRLKYYPLCQIVIRLWPTIYEFTYGTRGLYVTTGLSTGETIALFGFVFFLPLGGKAVLNLYVLCS